jgi:hypothetical protein
MRVLAPSRRNAVAARFALLAAASLGLIVVAAVFQMRAGLRSALAGAAVCGYVLFAGRAMELLQGRGFPRLDGAIWRRHFLAEEVDPPLPAQPSARVDVRSARDRSPEAPARTAGSRGFGSRTGLHGDEPVLRRR